MDIADLLNGLKVRAPYQAVGRPLLRHVGCAIHVGYENSIREALKGESPDADWTELAKWLTEHLVAGEKMVQAIKLTKAQKITLVDWIKGSPADPSSPLTQAFPGVASNADLVTNRHSDPACVGWLDLAAGVAGLYTSSRTFLERIELPTASLKDGAANGYETLYAMKRNFLQTYDAIFVPSTGDWALICADFPRSVPQNFALPSLSSLAHFLRKALGGSISFINFWPAVDGLYQSNEGKLVDYGFVVEGKAVNNHTARKISESLRDAKYDKAGAAVVGDDLDVFKVSVEWQYAHPGQPKTSPELTLPGTAHMLASAMPVLDRILIRNCLSSRDLVGVVSKLLPYI